MEEQNELSVDFLWKTNLPVMDETKEDSGK
jgi:hypothetical protein